MKVKELIDVLKTFDEELIVTLQVREDSTMLRHVHVETKDHHTYDQGDHVLDFYELDKCLMLSDDDEPEFYED